MAIQKIVVPDLGGAEHVSVIEINVKSGDHIKSNDALVTLEGRRQISTGDMKIEYVSFTDGGTYYAADIASGSSDASSRIFLEACNLPQVQERKRGRVK